MPKFMSVIALIGFVLTILSLAAGLWRRKEPHPIFADEYPPLTPTEPDQQHHDERRNSYLNRLNKWIHSLSDSERAKFEKMLADKLAAYQKRQPPLKD